MPPTELVDVSDLNNYYTIAQVDNLIAGLGIVYSPIGHNHAGVYSPVGHTHVKAEITDFAHTHTFASKDGITGIAGVADATTYLRGDGTWATPASGGSPGGADTHIQFNDGGVFGGEADLTYNKTTNQLIINGAILSYSEIRGFEFYMANTTFGYYGRIYPTTLGIKLADNAATSFGLLQLGGETNLFPAIKRSTTAVHIRLADDSGFSDIVARSIVLDGAPAVAAAGQVSIGGDVRTTIGANGAASALTTNPVGYIDIDVAGVAMQIPYYTRGA